MRRTNFMMVVFQQANSNGKKKKYLGKIKYRVDYDFITSTLTVTVIECKVGIHYEQQNKGYARPETKSFDRYDRILHQQTIMAAIQFNGIRQSYQISIRTSPQWTLTDFLTRMSASTCFLTTRRSLRPKFTGKP